jgi:hypothetical protein
LGRGDRASRASIYRRPGSFTPETADDCVGCPPPPLTCHMRSFPSDSSRDPERQRLRPAAHVRCASEEMHAHHATHRFFNQSLTCASVIRPAPVKHAKNVAATWRQGRSTLGKWSESFAVDDAAAAGRSVIDGGDESTAPGPLLLFCCFLNPK